MSHDIRHTHQYREAEALYNRLWRPKSGEVIDAADANASPDCGSIAFTGTIMGALHGLPRTRICVADTKTGHVRALTDGQNAERLPKYSPDGRYLAFLTDVSGDGNFQLSVFDLGLNTTRPTPVAPGWVEYFHWSPDGTKIVLGVAGHGSDIGGAQGAVTSAKIDPVREPWMPEVSARESEPYRWRCACIYQLGENALQKLALAGHNVWEVTWCGNESLVMLTSPGPEEDLWYSAAVFLFRLAERTTQEVYKSGDQIGMLSASPSGRRILLVDAVCSDRGIVAGNAIVVDAGTGTARAIPANNADVTSIDWPSDDKVLLAGHRRDETVVGSYDFNSDCFTELWSSNEIGGVGRYVNVARFGKDTNFVLIGEGFARPPEIAVIRNGQYSVIKSLAGTESYESSVIGGIDYLEWKAPDGLTVEGWLIRPNRPGPNPLVMHLHGGPVWHRRPSWLGRWGIPILMLLSRQYAVFFPNPRGSTGRGQEYARLVQQDAGGADARDCLSGLDYLIANGFADPNRLGVTGVSYGGYLTAWLITQDRRFAAAVPVAPITNFVTERLISNIPHFTKAFVETDYTKPAGKHITRSPIMHAAKVCTPTLNICGALDRCSPPEEAIQFHNALLERDVVSVLVTYPREGHGIRNFPAVIDYAARVVTWFEQHMPPKDLEAEKNAVSPLQERRDLA